MAWSTACADWAKRLRDRQSIIPAPLFPDVAEQALEIFKMLTMVDVIGQPTFGEVCDQFVFDLVAAIFGSLDPDTQRRLIREVLMVIPKKNGKSTIAAGIMITALILSQRRDDEMLILAPTKEVAENAFKPAMGMIKADPNLMQFLDIQDHLKTITNLNTGATLKVVAADAGTVGGKKASWVLIDEEWLFGKMATAEDMFREATGGLASRPEGIVIKLTTQSDEPPAGVFKKDLERARNIRDGKVVDEQFLPVLYEYPDDMLRRKEYLNPDTWYMVVPNLGKSVDLGFLRRSFATAQVEGEKSMLGFLSKYLNVEIGLNLRSDRWRGADFWQEAGNKAVTFEEILRRSEVVTAGIDGGGLDDLLGLALVGRCAETADWLFWGHAWAHRIVLDTRKDIASKLLDFETDGDLTIVERPGEDVSQLADYLCQVREAGLFPADDEPAVGVDSAGIGDILDELLSEDRDFKEAQFVGISQGWRLNAAIKTTERKVAGGGLKHGGQPLMAWCVSNAKVVQAGNAIYVTKQASGTAKIDPLMAGFNAVTLMSRNPAGQGKSFWDT
ncbi:MAG: terminase large subunit [Pseudomonadota bacterium]